MGTLNGRIALVTGGSRSLGREIALRLAEAGADVVITYKSNEAAAHDTARAIEALGAKAVVLQADLTGTAALPDIVGRVEAALDQHFGGRDLNILINNAGITGHGTFDTLTEEALDALYQTNLKSGLFLIQRLLPRLKDGGRIINVSSGLCRFTVPGMGAYACLKSAVETATRYLAKELGGRRITVNVVAPGALDTDFNAAAFEHNPQMKAFIGQQTTLGRVGLAEDVGGVVRFLCSDDAGWITGERLEVSGGMFL